MKEKRIPFNPELFAGLLRTTKNDYLDGHMSVEQARHILNAKLRQLQGLHFDNGSEMLDARKQAMDLLAEVNSHYTNLITLFQAMRETNNTTQFTPTEYYRDESNPRGPWDEPEE